MKNYTFLITLFFSVLVSSTSHGSPNVNDFCVADINGPDSHAGYHCKPAKQATANDFVFTFPPSNSSNPYKVAFSTASVNEFHGLNGQGISSTLVTIEQGGVVPMHTHPGGTELLYVVEGSLYAGFVTPTKEYAKTIKKGDLILFPQGLLHFQVNSGKGKAIAVAFYNSEDPSLHLLPQLLFSNKLSSDIVSKTTMLDVAQVNKAKARLGGSGVVKINY